jgi:hypothetical protein
VWGRRKLHLEREASIRGEGSAGGLHSRRGLTQLPQAGALRHLIMIFRQKNRSTNLN